MLYFALYKATRFTNASLQYWAHSTGRRNTFNQGGVYGATCSMDADVDGARSDAIAGRAVASA
jgi:hypothetical protein